jgi:nucleoside-diphosphate-sugar epimerase/predicted dehydrogenase
MSLNPKDKTQQPIRLLILGGGAVVSEFYIPAIQRFDGIFETLIVDPSPATLPKLSVTSSTIHTQQAGFREFLCSNENSKQFDAVIVALPNHLHAEATGLALNRNLDVLCEKPLALDAASCIKLGNLAKKKNRILAVGMVRRLLPSISALREALNHQLIGKIKSVEVEDGSSYRWLSNTGTFFERRNGGCLADMGVHYLDLISELIGKLKPLKYKDDEAGGVEANADYELVSENDVPVRIVLSRTHLLNNKLIVKGDKGELVVEKEGFESCLWRSSTTPELVAKLSSKIPFQGGDWDASLNSAFSEQLFEFKKSILERSPPRVNAFQSVDVIGLIDWAYQERTRGRIRITDAVNEKTEMPKLEKGKVLITGGTGFIGGHVVERLAKLGFEEIVAPVRNYNTCAELARFAVQMPKIDLLDSSALKKAMKGSSYVFHLAYGKDVRDSQRITVEGTKRIVNAAIEAEVKSIVVLSTMYVFGHPNTEVPVDEDSFYDPVGGHYGKNKAAMEKWCLRRARDSKKTRIILLNPTCVYGPRGTTYTQMPIELARESKFCWIEDGCGIANYLYVENLVDAIFLAATCKEAHGQRFIINDGTCSWKEFVSPWLGTLSENLPSLLEAELKNLNPLNKLSCTGLLISLANNLEVMNFINQTPVLGAVKRAMMRIRPGLKPAILKRRHLISHKSEKAVPPIWLEDLFGKTKTTFSSKKAHAILGWQSRIPLNEARRLTIDWLRQRNLYSE